MVAVNSIQYQAELSRLNVTVAEEDSRFDSLTQWTAPEMITHLLSLQTRNEPSMDLRTQAAYLINGFSWQLSCILAWLDLRGLSFDDVAAGKLLAYPWLEQGVHAGEPYYYVRYQWYLPRLCKADQPLAAGEIGKRLVEILKPIVHAVKTASGLSIGAQWRLVTDGLTFSYLYLGQQSQQAAITMERAQSIVDAIGKPLSNRQWRYQYYPADAESACRDESGSWYRVRGGCCRFYTLPKGEYCTTCVHLKEDERTSKIRLALSQR